jgi:hypothetical protein
MDAWRPKHVEDYDTIKCLWKWTWKCIQFVTLLWLLEFLRVCCSHVLDSEILLLRSKIQECGMESRIVLKDFVDWNVNRHSPHIHTGVTNNTTEHNTTQINQTQTTTNLIPSRSISFSSPSQYHATAAYLIEFGIRCNMLRNELEEKLYIYIYMCTFSITCFSIQLLHLEPTNNSVLPAVESVRPETYTRCCNIATNKIVYTRWSGK